MSEHLGYDKHHPPADGEGGDIRNDTRSKTGLTDAAGEFTVEVPRDRGDVRAGDRQEAPTPADGCGLGGGLVVRHPKIQPNR